MSALPAYPGDVAHTNNGREVVRDRCGITSWQGCCVSCGLFLPSRFYVELHTAAVDHVVALACPVHGLEATA